MMGNYILDADGEPVAADLETWSAWFEDGQRDGRRVVLQEHPARGVLVSTVFLGLDHNWRVDGAPVLWETMIFGGLFADYQDRYDSRLKALLGHARCVALINAYRAVPRKTKRALQKFAAAYMHEPSATRRPREQRRLHRVLARIGWRA